MLELIRKHSKSIVVKAFLTVLALTFVLFFGISDVIRRFTGKDYVVKIGNAKISPIDFKNEKARRLGLLRGRAKDFNEKEATIAILHQLIWENIVDQAAGEYGITVSDETMKRYVAGMNMFRDKNGRFNAGLLRGFLQKIQVPEVMFLESCRKDVENALMKAPFLYISTAAEQDLFTQASLEKRTLSIVELKPSSFKISEKPTKEALENFHSENPDLFSAPETRRFRILTLQESIVEANVQISEEEIRETYDRSPEREDRSYDEMKKEIAANLKQEKLQSEINELTRQIEDALMAGDDAAEVAKKFNLEVIEIEDVDADGGNAKSKSAINLPYKDDVLAVAFSIDEGTDSSFSEALDANKNKVYWLAHVDAIIPKHVVDFEKSIEKVEKEWIARKQREKAQETAANLIAKAKEGESLEKSAVKGGFAVGTTQAFDRRGGLQDEKNAKFKDIIKEIYEDAFSLEKTVANSKEIKGVIVVYQLKEIIAPKKIDPKDEKKCEIELQSEIVSDMYQQLVGYLSKKYEVKINRELLKEIDEETSNLPIDDIF
ncbi:MAG: SurA N-terminal domain-containing protein [Holosporaceae bacterium]|jgi:peptidyl-prolyl cis-trans isomerase D|nr:SurA N-terminal domain-containing protein [Holosporaceae bacterium]